MKRQEISTDKQMDRYTNGQTNIFKYRHTDRLASIKININKDGQMVVQIIDRQTGGLTNIYTDKKLADRQMDL